MQRVNTKLITNNLKTMFTANCKIPNPPVHFCSEDKNFSDAVRRTEHSGHAFITLPIICQSYTVYILYYIYFEASCKAINARVNYINCFFDSLIYEKYTIKLLWQKKMYCQS